MENGHRVTSLLSNDVNETSIFDDGDGVGLMPSPGLPEGYQTGLIVLYSITSAMAVLGNLVVIVVLATGRRSKTDLRVFLLNLAVADLTMAVFCMPFTFTTTMLHDWIFGASMCTVVLFLQVTIRARFPKRLMPALFHVTLRVIIVNNVLNLLFFLGWGVDGF